MPVDFTHEVVSLWRKFSSELQAKSNPLASSAQIRLDDAIAQSALVVANEVNRRHRIGPIGW
jgi:hypothetical protein